MAHSIGPRRQSEPLHLQIENLKREEARLKVRLQETQQQLATLLLQEKSAPETRV